MGWKHTALSAVRSLGGFRLLDAFYGRGRVTVLAHHRIVDPDTAGFVGFRGNASATPSEFEEQMAWVAEHMTPVGIDRVVASLDGSPLPDRPVPVRFDDGYRDDLTVVAPILRHYGIPGDRLLGDRPARPSEVARDPHAVRHVYVHHGDDPARFGAKVSGVPRLVGGG